MKAKKGFELSTSFLVTLILSITILSMGIYFLKRVFNSSEDITKMPIENFNKQIENILCDANIKVCVGTNNKEIPVGKYAVYTLNIQNHFDKEKTFSVKATVKNGVKKDGSTIREEDWKKIKYLVPKKEYKIKGYDNERVGVAVQPSLGSIRGTYTIKIEVNYKDDSGVEQNYGNEIIYAIVV
ncbi:MAG: hypothetical protein ACP5OZ_02340 [Candidatus Woesearchaeota archaeon]